MPTDLPPMIMIEDDEETRAPTVNEAPVAVAIEANLDAPVAMEDADGEPAKRPQRRKRINEESRQRRRQETEQPAEESPEGLAVQEVAAESSVEPEAAPVAPADTQQQAEAQPERRFV